MKPLTPKRKTGPEPRSELRMFARWNSEAVRALINRKTAQGRKPAYLFVGQEEAELLRHHLGTAFGPEAVRCLKNLYYVGLEVIEVEKESFLRTAGIKRVSSLEEALNRTPTARDLEASSFWKFAIL
jgi:hypothetical protein